ncbi:MAG: cell division protein FtsA [Firmicutes bacterium]|nr:cell division protein FtsA [Bacillota bacterium]
MAKRPLILAVDVGTTKVSALVGEVRTDGDLTVLGIAATPVVGMRRGLVFEMERVALAIRDAVNRANSMAGTDLSHAAVAVNGDHLAMTAGQARMSLKTGTVRQEDLAQVMRRAAQSRQDPDREVVEVLPHGLAVDGFRGVSDPVGMIARELEMDVWVVSGLTTVLRNLRRVLTMAGVTPVVWVPAPRASADGVLSLEEKKVGVVHLDIGGGTTGITLYRGGQLEYLGIVPLGGESITSDLSVGLGVVSTQAERLKLEYAAVGAEREGTVEVRAVSGQSVKVIPVKELEEIVAARVEEWTQFVEQHLARLEWPKAPGAGVVMTGGGSLLKGLPSYLEQRWGWPVRLGVPGGLGGLSDLSRSPGYAVVVGVARNGRQAGAEAPRESWLRQLIQFWLNLWN